MRGSVYKVVILMAALALGLGLGFMWMSSTPAAVQAAPELSRQDLLQKPDNSMCLGCHGSTDKVVTFPNGDTVSIAVDAGAYDHGVHVNLACQVCHTNITGYPHPENAAASAKEYTLQYKDTCKQCHPGQAEDVTGSAHYRMASEGNSNTPVCADCHTPHALIPKYIVKAQSGYHHVTAFVFGNIPDAIRAKESSKEVIQENCIRCHEKTVEDVADGQMDAGRYCFSCHRSVAHGERGISILPYQDAEK